MTKDSYFYGIKYNKIENFSIYGNRILSIVENKNFKTTNIKKTSFVKEQY
jgi:hypothetical protein